MVLVFFCTTASIIFMLAQTGFRMVQILHFGQMFCVSVGEQLWGLGRVLNSSWNVILAYLLE